MHSNHLELFQATRLQSSLYEILDAAIAADYAILGNIQLFNPQMGSLQIVAQRGFDFAFMKHFAQVRADDGSACGRSLRQQERIMISDVTLDAGFAPHRAIAEANRFRAVQSTPVFKNGVLRGVLSTHFPQAHSLSENARVTLDQCAAKLSALLD